MDTQELRCWLALHHTPGIKPKRFYQLISQAGNAQAVLSASPSWLASTRLNPDQANWIRNPDWNLVDRDIAWSGETGNRILVARDPDYPELLQQISDAPPVLYTRGNVQHLHDLQIAIVGSRNPTPGGRQTARDFAHFLGKSGMTVTSGLALGIDAAAHEGAIAAGAATVAVMGNGLDRIYPARHRDLADTIAANGVLVSEFPLGTDSRPEHFPQRNRIVSGLSIGVLVVEAALRSGSLITARHALEQGREIFAIPGSIHNPLVKGCHQLIRDGAKLVENARDIIVELGALANFLFETEKPAVARQSDTKPDSNTGEELDQEYHAMLDNMGHDPVSVDALVQRTGLSVAEVSSMLLILELKGLISANPGGTYSRNQA